MMKKFMLIAVNLIISSNIIFSQNMQLFNYHHHLKGVIDNELSACYYFQIQGNNIILPKLWINKDLKRSKIIQRSMDDCGKYMSLDIKKIDQQNYLIFTLESGQSGSTSERNNPTIISRRGGCFIVLPKDIIIDYNNIETKWFDVNYDLLKGSKIPNFEKYVYDAIKFFTPEIIGKISEETGKFIGAGNLENFEPNKIFYDNQQYTPIFIKWESIYDKGKIINAYYLKFSIPIKVSTMIADELLNNFGFGIFYYLDFSTGSNIGIIIPSFK